MDIEDLHYNFLLVIKKLISLLIESSNFECNFNLNRLINLRKSIKKILK
jgi:hypothetical protein